MTPLARQARNAGLIYLAACITAPFGLVYVPNVVLAPGNATATAGHLRASETLLRWGFASELLNSIGAIFMGLALYHLFKNVRESHAMAMVTLLLISVPISLLNMLNEIAALTLARGAPFLAPIGPDQRDALAYLFLRLHGQGMLIAAIFWGLWLFPFGLLVLRSGFIPRILGVLLFFAGSGYLVNSLAALLVPQSAHLVAPFAMALEFGELPIVLWLVFRGARDQPPAQLRPGLPGP